MISHSSHVYQSLDLFYFSVYKSAYRIEIVKLTRFDDSEKIKKIQFIRLYKQARKESLILKAIKSEFRAAEL